MQTCPALMNPPVAIRCAGVIEVCVFVHDHCSIPAEFEAHPLPACDLAEVPAYGAAAR